MNIFKTKYTKDIDNIEVYGFDFKQLIPDVNYLDLWKKYKFSVSQAEARSNNFWVSDSNCEITIRFKSGLSFRYTIKAGYVTDFASVPKFLKSFMDDNDPKIIIAAIIHDINYGTHLLSFETSNTLFYQMMRYYKMSYFNSKKAYFAVEFFGKSRFKITPEKVKKTMEKIKFEDFYNGWDKHKRKN